MTAGIVRLEGVWTIVPTPFRPDGALDTDSLSTLTRFIADQGVDGMTILGVLGEAGRLGDDERDAVIAGVLASAGDLPVCVGVSHAGTDRAVAFAISSSIFWARSRRRTTRCAARRLRDRRRHRRRGSCSGEVQSAKFKVQSSRLEGTLSLHFELALCILNFAL